MTGTWWTFDRKDAFDRFTFEVEARWGDRVNIDDSLHDIAAITLHHATDGEREQIKDLADDLDRAGLRWAITYDDPLTLEVWDRAAEG